MARVDNISAWNAKVGDTHYYIGANGVHYEYAMPKSYSGPWYREALTVRSKKSPTTRYNNGKKPGQYQPVGAKKYFTYFQQKMMRKNGEDIWDLVLSESNRLLKRARKNNV